MESSWKWKLYHSHIYLINWREKRKQEKVKRRELKIKIDEFFPLYSKHERVKRIKVFGHIASVGMTFFRGGASVP